MNVVFFFPFRGLSLALFKFNGLTLSLYLFNTGNTIRDGFAAE